MIDVQFNPRQQIFHLCFLSSSRSQTNITKSGIIDDPSVYVEQVLFFVSWGKCFSFDGSLFLMCFNFLLERQS